MTAVGDALQTALQQLALRPLRNVAGKVLPILTDNGNLFIDPRAAAGRIVVAPGQAISSAWGNTVFDQSVVRFASAADRDNQWPAPQDGAVCWLDDVKQFVARKNGVWGPWITGTHRLRISRTAAWTLGTGAWVAVPGMTVEPGQVPSSITCPLDDRIQIGVAGGYICGAGGSWPGNATGRRGWAVVKNGAAGPDMFNQDLRLAASAALGHVYSTVLLMELAAGDYIRAMCYQDAGVNLGMGAVQLWAARVY